MHGRNRRHYSFSVVGKVFSWNSRIGKTDHTCLPIFLKARWLQAFVLLHGGKGACWLSHWSNSMCAMTFWTGQESVLTKTVYSAFPCLTFTRCSQPYNWQRNLDLDGQPFGWLVKLRCISRRFQGGSRTFQGCLEISAVGVSGILWKVSPKAYIEGSRSTICNKKFTNNRALNTFSNLNLLQSLLLPDNRDQS